MKFEQLKKTIHDTSIAKDFEKASLFLEELVFHLSKKDFIPIVTEIGTIPEDIAHDSSEEKLYAKVADIVLAKCFQELGLSANVIKTRANCADVSAKSNFHSYSLVGDAKAFRLSRTAKNQKDFKVQSMAHWKGDCEFSVLVCPFFQYPRSRSQIYTQALDNNVLLSSWEHLSFLLKNDIVETECVSLAPIWNSSYTIAKAYSRADKEVIFWDKQDAILCELIKKDFKELQDVFKDYKEGIIHRGHAEIFYFENVINDISGYSKEKAIAELIKTKKLNEKIRSIQEYITYLRNI